MTRAMRSVFDRWLEPDVRDKVPVGFSMHDYLTIRRQAEEARHAGRGKIGEELDHVARNWNLDRRTLYRYTRDPIETVTLNGWSAVYRVPKDGPPRRVTAWSREPMQTEREETK